MGSARSRPRRWLLSLVIIAGAGLAFIPALQAVHDDGLFELDRDATNDVAVPGDDWADIYNNTSSATSKSFTFDGEGPTIFTGGSTKDDLDTTGWLHKSGSTPPKDELLDGFAARYGNNLYFGADRIANNGDSVMGLWFFQNEVVPQPDGTFGTAGHKNGDILVLSDFSGGGGNVTIRVFQWHSPGGAINGTLDLLAGTLDTPADCVGPPSAPANDPFCATVNRVVTPSPWPFAPKSAPAGFFQPGEFYEGGIDLSFLHLENECFASFLAETRASTSVDSTLKDFVGGSFEKCGSTLTTTPQVATGATFADISGPLSIGTGSVSVRDKAVLTITGAGAWSGTLNFHLCGPTALADPYVACATGGTLIGSPVAVSNGAAPVTAFSDPTTVTSAGKYCWRGDFTTSTPGVPPSTDATTGECFTVNPVTPTIPTQASAAVLIGNAISDMANLSGTASRPDGSPAGGTITFNLYGPNDATCSVSIHSATVNVTGDGAYTDNFTPTTAGTYRWVASYSGDLPNTLSRSGACNDANESVIVNPKQPTITTDASADPPTGTALGSAISDQATLSGTAAGAGGTITFIAYGPDDATCATAVFTSTPVSVNGDGTYDSPLFTPTAPGTYRWIASYSGDLPNTLAVSGNCNDAGEASLITQTTISTVQTFTVKDSATISATGTGDLAGNVRFQLFNNSTCDPGAANANRLYDSGPVSVSGSSPQTVSSGTTTITTSQPTLSWLVIYTSTNPTQPSVTSACNTEHSSLSITNGS
jgi:hypothetical protein